jgi:hypothetical protein
VVDALDLADGDAGDLDVVVDEQALHVGRTRPRRSVRDSKEMLPITTTSQAVKPRHTTAKTANLRRGRRSFTRAPPRTARGSRGPRNSSNSWHRIFDRVERVVGR